jgi:hypothetical protein
MILRSRRLILVVVVYICGYLAASLIGVLASGHGFESSANAQIPYYVIFCVAFGLWLKRWWGVVFPIVHFYLVASLVNAIRYHGPVTYSYDRMEFVLLGTVAIAIGVAIGIFVSKQVPRGSTNGPPPPS